MKPSKSATSTVSRTSVESDAFATTEKLNLTENDFVVKHKDEDPYGFWWVSREKGQVPACLAGAYTTLEAARNAVKAYIQVA